MKRRLSSRLLTIALIALAGIAAAIVIPKLHHGVSVNILQLPDVLQVDNLNGVRK